MSRPRPSAEEKSSSRPEHFWTGLKKFPAKMEAEFQAEMELLRDRHVRRTGLIAAILYCAFAISDRVMLPDIYHQAWKIRFFLVLPLMLICTFSVPKIRQQIWREILMSGTLIVVGASLVWIAGMSRHPNAQHYHTGITLITLFGNIVLNLRFRDAVFTSAVISIVYALSLWFLSAAAPEVRFNAWLFGFAVVLISLIANFRTDQGQRRAYLARSREQARNTELSHAVELLAKLSSEDALTKLANRREFDRRLDLEWGRAKREQQSLALILIDVDCFKAYNDHYGHPAGDACLQQIAAVLRAVPKRSSDLVARFGGEEFIVLLPGTSTEEAAELAERMRVAVRELHLSHAYSNAGPMVTASFGVCAMQPAGDELPAELLADADAALYRAKEGGRNRVVVDSAHAAGVTQSKII